jgi:hypothetical protein
MHQKSDRYVSSHSLYLLPSSSWVKIPASSFVITSAVFVVFVLDMANPGYASFAFIPDLRPQISTLTADIRSDLENLTRSTTLPAVKNKKKPDKSSKCQTLLDSYNPDGKCHFEPTNYSNISRSKFNTKN